MDALALGTRGRCAAVITGLIIAVACGGGKRTTTTLDLSRPECPQGRLDIEVMDTVDSVPTVRHITEIPVAGPITNIPEFHDCQRFIGTSAGDMTYGPMVAIFANHLLDSLYTGQFDRTADETQAAAAEIYSYDGAYDPLHIRQGFNCLYLTKPAGGKWEAYMAPVGNDEKACLQPHRGQPLRVVTNRHARDDKDIPAVARWDFDTVNQRQYIGIKCGLEWCEVGGDGLKTSAERRDVPMRDEPIPGLSLAPATPTEKARVVLIKGWYDEQYLAEGTTGDLKPMHVRGTAFPHPMLDRMKDDTMFARGWKPVAYLFLDGDPGMKYKKKLNIEQGMNTVYYCFGTFSECGPAGMEEPSCPTAADHKWWARIESGQTHEVKYYCVTRRTHPNGDETPGAVRWRWSEDDETLWVRCPQGCCAVH